MVGPDRCHEPEFGQFTQTDPIGIAGGLNTYGYAGGDPINFSDPFGLSPCTVPSPRCIEMAAVAAMDAAVDGLRVIADGLVGLATSLIPGPFDNAAAAGLAATTGTGSRRALWRQLASEELLGEARAGIGASIAGAGARAGRGIDDIGRLTNQYGGDAADWAKMTTGTRVDDSGMSMAVHWYENVQTGFRVEFKTKLGN